ncbi:methyl-accepting chemotaxis protein [Rhizobiaceae bacterium BDR2-2]|uniref:Methyl-accepting chemotaxis protein n=1 Tax=Ectorhizobium quercum TaxID=2965071 RepID=A0AAE3N033_9HYPH|nr:methyl-accepting chemotaxis protein [Ectorhizobium quercum]MCX8997512.1 methyl-accepting chemotaxis protein [Ectorhizobium quercum]
MSKFSIKKQIWFAFLILLSALVAVSGVALYAVFQLSDNSRQLADKAVPSVRYSMKLRADINDLRVSGLYHILFETPEEMASEYGWWEKKIDWVEETRRTYEGYADTEEEHRILAAFDTAWGTYVEAAKETLALSTNGQKRDAFRADRATLTPLIDVANDASTQLVEYAQQESNTLRAEALAIQKTVSFAITAAIVIAGLLACVTVLLLTSSVGKAIASIIAPMKRLAAGELDVDVPHRGKPTEVGAIADAVQVFKEGLHKRAELEQQAARFQDELDRKLKDAEAAFEAAAHDQAAAVDALATGLAELSAGNVAYQIAQPFAGKLDRLRLDFNGSLSKLNAALSSVGEASNGIDAGSREIQAAADDLSRRTEQQAASVEETAAALEEITTTVKDSTRRAEEAGELVARTRKGAEQSGEIVRNAVSAMQEIEKSSSEISNIIGVIDEIAFQTNLLALNAGVEAARAGDAGKGFAVVAQEVRELAQRSANAAKEIKELIVKSGEQVRKGVHLVGETGTSLEKIVAEVQDVTRNVTAIVESAREQSTGLQEINTAVNTMDQGTQQNAAMVEQQTAASHNLAREATTLKQLLSQFRLSGAAQLSALRPANGESRPVASPARERTQAVARAFSGNAALAVDKSEWEEF